MPSIKSLDTFNRIMAGSPGDYRYVGDDLAIRGIMVNNDTPNTVYVLPGRQTGTTSGYILRVPARAGRQIPLAAIQHLTVLADPAGSAVAATDEVTISASPDPLPGSAWNILGSGGSTIDTELVAGPGTGAGDPLYAELASGPGTAAASPMYTAPAGSSGILANNAAAAANATVNTGAIALFRTAVAMVTVSAATTITAYVRSATGLWYPVATWQPTAAGSEAIAITAPSTGIQVGTSAAVTWTVEYQTAS